MTGGRNLLLLGGALAIVSCTASHQIQVRAIPNPGASSKSCNALLAQARGELALGNVGLALENLRTVQREQPEDVGVSGWAADVIPHLIYGLITVLVHEALTNEDE